jgi:hypothetical protein
MSYERKQIQGCCTRSRPQCAHRRRSKLRLYKMGTAGEERRNRVHLREIRSRLLHVLSVNPDEGKDWWEQKKGSRENCEPGIEALHLVYRWGLLPPECEVLPLLLPPLELPLRPLGAEERGAE